MSSRMLRSANRNTSVAAQALSTAQTPVVSVKRKVSVKKMRTVQKSPQASSKTELLVELPTANGVVGPDADQATTPRKRAKKNPLPTTPKPAPSLGVDPSIVHSTGDIDDAIPTRPAAPNATNAPIKTPGGSRLTRFTETSLPASLTPSKRPTTTNQSLLEEACAHLLSAEPRLKPLIDKYRCPIFSPAGLEEEIDPFRSLTSGIMAQQVSGAAAGSIKKKFIALFNLPGASMATTPEQLAEAVTSPDAGSWVFPTPAQVAAQEVSFLRKAGLSERKAEYIKGLGEKFASGELSAKMLLEASYDEVLEKLTAVRGLGQWSVEMFACFGLKRMDVFSTGDLGVQRGMAAFVGKDIKKLKAKGGGKWKYMSEKDMLDYAEKFAPYRSLLMWYMWKVEDVDVDAIQNA